MRSLVCSLFFLILFFRIMHRTHLQNIQIFVKMKNFSDFRYNKTMPLEHCEHVYRDMRANPCPKCGKETREINWKYQEQLHKEWIASGKAVAQGWWSI